MTMFLKQLYSLVFIIFPVAAFASSNDAVESISALSSGIVNADFSSTQLANGPADQNSLGLGWYAKNGDNGSVASPDWSIGATADVELGVLTRIKSSGSATRMGQFFCNQLTGDGWALSFELNGRLNRVRLFAGALKENPSGTAFNQNSDNIPGGGLVNNGWTVLMDESNISGSGEVVFNLSEDLGNFDVMVINIRSNGSDGLTTLDNFEFVPQVTQAAIDDAFNTSNEEAINASVFDNDLGDAINSPLVVTAVEGLADNVDAAVTLGSGALLNVAADGTFSYDSTGVFDQLAPGSSTTDNFSYTVGQGEDASTADVTITITAPTALESFRETYGLASDLSDDALDWSGNGIANLLYLAFGFGDPNEANVDRSRLPELLESSGFGDYSVTFVQPKVDTGLTVRLKTNDELSTSFVILGGALGSSYDPVEIETESLDDDYERVTYHFDLINGEEKRFYQIEVIPTSALF